MLGDSERERSGTQRTHATHTGKVVIEPESSTDVIAALAQAFPPRPIDPEQAFAGTVYLDADRFKASSRGKSWTELEPAFLEFHHDAISFLAPKAFAEIVPAYLATTLTPGEAIDVMPITLLRTLTHSDDARATFDARMEELTPEQQLAVARALAAGAAAMAGMLSQSPAARGKLSGGKSGAGQVHSTIM